MFNFKRAFYMKLKSNLNEKRNIYYVQEGKFVILSYYNKKIV